MNFDDIFKSSFMERINTFSLVDSLIVLALSFILGMFVYVIYRKTYSGVMYNSRFGISLIGLSMITSFVILAVTSNVVLSLGMVGALSIVRFRTAIKESMDIVFLFWAIAIGIVLGAGLIPLAVIGTVIIGIVMVAFSYVKASDTPYILVVHSDSMSREAELTSIIRKNTKKCMIKAKTSNNAGTEITYEIRIRENDASVVDLILAATGVKDAALVTYNGEYMS